MPVYNAGKFSSFAIQSILEQTFNDYELIIVDDGSTDESAAIANSFRDSRIKILKNERNRGIVYTRNRGLAAASGKRIIFIIGMIKND